MNARTGASLVLAAFIGGAAVFAATRSGTDAPATSSGSPAAPQATVASDDPHSSMALPPNHPTIGSASAIGAANEAPTLELEWKRPEAWKDAPSPSTMRLATYKVPAAKGDAEDAEVSVVRAGGTADENVNRWVRQFDDASTETRTDKTIAGMKVTFVEVSGSYLGSGMSPTPNADPKKGWALHGAIAEAGGESYFFKMTGPKATVAAAHDAFVGMLGTLKKK